MKNYLCLMLVIIFSGAIAAFSFAQESKLTKVKGSIEQIAEDGSYIVVSGQKIYTTTETIEEAYFELGDKVEIKAEDSPKGLQVINYEYIYEDEPEPEYDRSDDITYPDKDFVD